MSDVPVPSQQPIGESGFGFSATSGTDGTVVVATPVPGVGPTLNVSYSWSHPENLPVLSYRLKFFRSDFSTGVLYDTGWVGGVSLASGTSPNVDLLNCPSFGIPTDTGSGSSDPSLHLVVRVEASTTTDPSLSGNWATGDSAPFDIQWGVSSLSWTDQPPNLVSTSYVSAGWLFSSTRQFSQATWEVTLTSIDGSIVYFDSTNTAGAIDSYSPPYLLEAGTSYRLTVQAANINGIAAMPLSTVFVSGSALALSQQPPGGPLQRFLDMVGFQLDTSRSLVEQLRNVNRPLACPGNLLPALAQQLGVTYEAEMGMAQTRKLLNTVVHEYKNKGTAVGVTGISTAVTGWPTEVSVSPNIVLSTVQTASASLSQWLSSSPLSSSPQTGNPVPPSGYAGNGLPEAWPAGTATATNGPPAVAQYVNSALTATTAMDWSSLMGAPPSQWGIPVQGLTAVSAQIFLWLAGITAPLPSVTFSLTFWNSSGVRLSEVSSATSVPAAGAWTAFTVLNASVPTGAVWVSYDLTAPEVNFSATNGIVIVAAPQVNSGSTVAPGPAATPSYQPPREVNVTAFADRVNLLKNPSFETDSAIGWSALTNCTIAPLNGHAYQGVLNPLTNQPVVSSPGKYSLQVSSIAAGLMAIQSDPMPVNEALLYTGSIYCQPIAVAQGVRVDLICSGAQTDLMSGSVTAGTSTSGYPTTSVTPVTDTTSGSATSVSRITGATTSFVSTGGSATGTSAVSAALGEAAKAVSGASGSPVESVGLDYAGSIVQEIAPQTVNGVTTSPWVRPYAQVDPVLPLPAWVNQVSLRVTWLNTSSAGEQHVVDDALFEEGWALRPYFDAGMWDGSPNGQDYFWENPELMLGPSFYYQNYAHKITRLYDVLSGAPGQFTGYSAPFSLTGFLPVGVNFTLTVPQPISLA